MRTKARETVFQIVFASQFGGADNGLKSALYKKEKLTDDDIIYAENVLSVIGEHKEEFADIIDKRSTAFPESDYSLRIKALYWLRLRKCFIWTIFPVQFR